MTLRELCESFGISRRAVQGYEQYGLVQATDRTLRGYLLYDEDAQQTIRRIKTFQQFGFHLKEIQALFAAPPAVVRQALEQKRQELLNQRELLDDTLRLLERNIRELE